MERPGRSKRESGVRSDRVARSLAAAIAPTSFGLVGLTALASLAALVAAPARAVDGVVELNQTCATQTGCLAGDTPGFPITIGTSGSYRLTSNLVVPDANTDGLSIAIDDLSVDLNGFAIRGPVVCTLTPHVCTGTGTGIGINAPVKRISVRDGKVVGMGSFGLSLSNDAIVTNVVASSNRFFGIIAESGSTVGDSVASDNGTAGFFLGSSVVLRDCTATGNLGQGIETGSSAVLRGNVTTNNGGPGIITGIGSTIVGNSVRNNGSVGIQTGNAATIADNSVYLNGGPGIITGIGSLVRGNAIVSNAGFGLTFSNTTSGYRDNVLNANVGGTVVSGTNLGNNLCNGTTTCP